jgi:aerobic-type carbon monoxide dehydrogenase small subunit (CoxS/CutS family)
MACKNFKMNSGESMALRKISCRVNGITVQKEIRSELRLIDFLRENLQLTGVKEGCGEGECGACTVLLNGNPINSCLVLAVQAEGADILTIEGLAAKGELSRLQQAFIDYGAVQCGFCTPGMILSAKALLDKNPHPTEEEIRRAISGNLCRCTGYQAIVDAVQAVSSNTPHARQQPPLPVQEKDRPQ